MVSVTAALPGAALGGAIEESSGSGLGGGLMMNAVVLERPLFCEPEWGLRVCTVAVPVLAVNAAGTAAVSHNILELASSTGVW